MVKRKRPNEPIKPTKSIKKGGKKKPEVKIVQNEREQIANLCSQLLENPEENILKLNDIFEFSNDEVYDTTVKKLSILSQLAVFKDIIPGYRIREDVEKEDVQLSKEVRKLREFESTLLRLYKRYLQQLEGLISTVRSDFAFIGAKCLCELLKTHPHFNFHSNIVAVVVPLMNSRSEEISDLCCETTRAVFVDDVNGTTSLEIVKIVSKYIKNKSYNVKVKMLDTFLNLKLNEALGESRELEDSKTKSTKKKVKKDNELREVERELNEATAVQNKQERRKIQTEILKNVFVTYFRILKKSENNQPILIPSVLRGFAKFAHLINVEVVTDLLQAVKTLLQKEGLELQTRFQAIITAFEVLKNQEPLNIDLKEFYNNLYTSLLQIVDNPSGENFNQIMKFSLKCLQCLLHDTKQVPIERVASFIKRVSILSLHLPPHAALAAWSFINSTLKKYPRSTQLLDGETVGSGIFLWNVDDPEYANALASTLSELNLLRYSYHPTVAKIFLEIQKAHLKDSQENFEHSDNILGLGTLELFRLFDTGKGGFNPAIQKPHPHPLKKRLNQKKPVFIQTKFSLNDSKIGKELLAKLEEEQVDSEQSIEASWSNYFKKAKQEQKENKLTSELKELQSILRSWKNRKNPQQS